MRVLGENLIDSEKRKERRYTSREMSQSLTVIRERTREKRQRGISMLDISLHDIYTMTMSTSEMIYGFTFRSDIEQEKDLHSMRIDVRFPGKIVGARPPSAACCSMANTELSALTRPILL